MGSTALQQATSQTVAVLSAAILCPPNKFIDACSNARTELLILDRRTLKSYDQAYQVFKILESKQAVVDEPKCSVAGVLWELGSHGGLLVQSHKVWVGIRVLGSKKFGVQSKLFMHFGFGIELKEWCFQTSRSIFVSPYTSRKHGEKELRSFFHCGFFDHHALQLLNNCKFVVSRLTD